MATKTSSKTATRKPAARKAAAAHKPPASKARTSKKKLELDAESAGAPAKPQQPPSAKVTAEVAPAPRHEVESISLIDKKKPRKKAEDGEVKAKRDVLPPISRIRASLETPAAPPNPRHRLQQKSRLSSSRRERSHRLPKRKQSLRMSYTSNRRLSSNNWRLSSD